jgi:hypothetical protein
MTNYKELKYAGSLGINLQATKVHRGAFVNDFFRSKETSEKLPAERSGKVEIGDLLVFIDDCNVLEHSLEQIYQLLKKSSTIKTVRFISPPNLRYLSISDDPWKTKWFISFITSYASENITKADIDRILTLHILENMSQNGLDKELTDDTISHFLTSHPNSISKILMKNQRFDTKTSLFYSATNKLHLLDSLTNELSTTFSLFSNSLMIKRMCGYLFMTEPYLNSTLYLVPFITSTTGRMLFYIYCRRIIK